MAQGDITLNYAADTQPTITLASLASSTTLVAGQESNVVDNTSTKYEDAKITGKITTGTTPTTATFIEVWIVPIINDTPTYPDVFDGTDSNETVTSRDILAAVGRLGAQITVDATSNRTYPFSFGMVERMGYMPDKFVFFVVHSTVAALNATGSNHEISVQGMYRNVTP